MTLAEELRGSHSRCSFGWIPLATSFTACAASEETTAANPALGREGATSPEFKGKGLCPPPLPQQACPLGSVRGSAAHSSLPALHAEKRKLGLSR